VCVCVCVFYYVLATGLFGSVVAVAF
jgi:hypothetical protein